MPALLEQAALAVGLVVLVSMALVSGLAVLEVVIEEVRAGGPRPRRSVHGRKGER
ncbi:hypothetical protein [Actinomadura macrotermitis]|uniref:Uncharacterized protein n=1 Tax=Actinomadura macrotermitis TaxID=2585200 RepID=A0A7K0C314_9ACTN|nr:hypothetical protein [Actinomadura macrotermitis]MQY07756.1 hypothetical protein [Actinomadura macrotermitis]